MYQPTLFSKILKSLPKNTFDQAREQTQSDKKAKSFSAYNHLTAMLYLHMAGIQSLRGLEIALETQPYSRHHLQALNLKRSTLADANKKRSFEFFECIFTNLLFALQPGQRRYLKSQIRILDSSPIPVRCRGSKWVDETATARCHGLKLHLGICHENSQLWFGQISNANINDISVAKNLTIEEQAVYVFDKGYCDYNWWHTIHEKNAYFVTRLKRNAAYKVIESREDCTIITLTNKKPRGKAINHLAGTPLKLLHVQHPSKAGKTLEIITNSMPHNAEEIGLMYKKRWMIEIMFRFLKQHVKLKNFIGESKNAILIQIYSALIAYVLMILCHVRWLRDYSLHEATLLIRFNLMQSIYRLKCFDG